MNSLKIKNIPLNERPIERLINYGSDKLNNEELLAILLKTGTKEMSSKVLATKIITEIGDISNLKSINYQRLTKIKGIGKVKAATIISMIELGKRINKKVTIINNLQVDNSSIIYNYYSFGGGSYWLDDGYYNVPFGTSKIVTIPTQQLTNVMFQYAGDPDFWSSFNVVITLKRHSAHPKTNAEAEAWGTTIRSWVFTMSQCRSINLNSSIIADVDQDLTIDANYRYFYHIKYGKNGVTVGGVNLAGQAAIVRKRDSWDTRSYAFYPFSMRLKYYFWK